ERAGGPRRALPEPRGAHPRRARQDARTSERLRERGRDPLSRRRAQRAPGWRHGPLGAGSVRRGGLRMARGVAVLLGTKKGAYIFRSGAARERWRPEGPYLMGQPVYHVAFDPRDGQSLYAGVNASWGGPRVEISRDLGKTWKPAKNPAFPAGDTRTFSRTWH